jgi:hypothetical protein
VFITKIAVLAVNISHKIDKETKSERQRRDRETERKGQKIKHTEGEREEERKEEINRGERVSKWER